MENLKNSLEDCLLLSLVEYDDNMSVLDILNLVREKLNEKFNINIDEIKLNNSDKLNYLELDEIEDFLNDFEN